jgi:xylulose-5-phosphate/fructose-6-phosphate phosphoketolase
VKKSKKNSKPVVAKRKSNTKSVLSSTDLRELDAYWRAANYLSVGQIYLYDNPLLKKPLSKEHIKPRLLGHWGTTPGLNFIYVHLNRLIKAHDLKMIYITGPGHGGPGLVANAYLEGTYSEVYPDISEDEEGMKRLFKQFSFPGGIPSHVAPETPGSIHEGGELGYALSHAYGAAFDNPDLIVAAVVGDGEAETGPMATSWHSNKFLNPVTDGAVLPILHLNGYKIANPTVLARITPEELDQLFRGYGYTPYLVEGHEPEKMHQLMADTLEKVIAEIKQIQAGARVSLSLSRRKEGSAEVKRPRWPMIVLRTPKGWTCPKEIDGKRTEDYWRSHQVPMGEMHENPQHVKILEQWMKSYRPKELFDDNGRFKTELAALAPKGEQRMSANPHANGGLLLRNLRLPDFRDYAVDVSAPGATTAEATQVQGKFLRDVMKLNLESRNFRLFSPDENNSNRWQDVLDVTNRVWVADRYPYDDHLAPDGRVMEMLSEHQCQGWLEGYLLTGRHGFFSCYEAFIHIVDSMFNQHAKWLKVSKQIPWRRPIASLNYLLSSHVWRQDHNGFSHQDPGFIDHVVNKKAGIVRVYLPPDANCLLSVTDHCLRSRNYVNVIVAGKQPAPQWLNMDQAIKHCTAGIGIWEWASNDRGGEPDVVMACCGDVPTLETLAAVDLLRQHIPELKIRVINVVDLMTLQPPSEHPHGLSDKDFDALFTTDKPIIFAFHGYPWLIHRLTYRRTNHGNLHMRGYKEEGTTTTPFDMCVFNDLDRFHLVKDVIDRVPQLGARAAYAQQAVRDALIDHKEYIYEHGEDAPQISGWTWGQRKPTSGRASSTESDNV